MTTDDLMALPADLSLWVSYCEQKETITAQAQEIERLTQERDIYKAADEAMQDQYGALHEEADELRSECQRMRALITKVHAAKGRHHTQIAMCDLFDAVGLANTRPAKVGRAA